MNSTLPPDQIGDRSGQYTGISIAALALAWAGVALRFYVRTFVIKKLAADDWLMLAGAAIFTACISCALKAIHYGLGRQDYQLRSPEQLAGVFKFLYIGELCYLASATTAKLGFGVFYLRLVTERWQKRVIYVVIICAVVFTLIAAFIYGFQCEPVNYLWTRFKIGDNVGPSNGHCISVDARLGLTYTHSALNTAIDWVLAMLPLAIIWKVQLPLRTRIAIIFVISLGAFASASTIARMIYISDFVNTPSFLWIGTSLLEWSTIEPAVALLAGGLAVSRPLLKEIKTKSTTHNSMLTRRSQSTSRFQRTPSSTPFIVTKGGMIVGTATPRIGSDATSHKTGAAGDRSLYPDLEWGMDLEPSSSWKEKAPSFADGLRREGSNENNDEDKITFTNFETTGMETGDSRRLSVSAVAPYM